ncbi:penicillin acylase family protein [Streptomyces sp. NBC_00557]|uniref:penicillin acylase family protein n=1 Tax=Streptomyces sp. NBC_00557 TaxID=2975776 RepID=UPI002E80B29A|nr:penicillin acylase family protein [Streptomyces sp. NBC_00557]WUC35994.1 penicillin acylase family protein [Streptomyces sp. NBC_00557]
MAIETYRDAWGIPHLRASSARELARAQGRVTARDRAWQLEVERHRAQGTSAAFLGADALSWDVLARRARLDDTARRCFAALEHRDPETADWVRCYADGVNEGLPAGADRAPEFARTGLTPGPWRPWTPLGVWLATHLLFAGFPAKLWREQAIRHLGRGAVALFAADGRGTAGSNGWLVTGARTATGHALIAGDPHRFIEDPGVYQQIRLSCPEFDVIGLAVPGVPGIAHFGHTGTVAEPPAYPEVLLPWLALVPRIGHALEHLLRAEELYGIDRLAAVRAALEEVAAGPPTGTWADTHRLTPWRALPDAAGDDREPGLAGDHDCVLCTSAVPGLTDRAARGPAARYVWDLADRAASRWIVPFGADGVPGSPHHHDQLPLWLRGELVPVGTDWTLLTRDSDTDSDTATDSQTATDYDTDTATATDSDTEGTR